MAGRTGFAGIVCRLRAAGRLCRQAQRKLRRDVLCKTRRCDPQAGHEQGAKPAKVPATVHTETVPLSLVGEQRTTASWCGEVKGRPGRRSSAEQSYEALDPLGIQPRRQNQPQILRLRALGASSQDDNFRVRELSHSSQQRLSGAPNKSIFQEALETIV